jgi:hypothetical protein
MPCNERVLKEKRMRECARYADPGWELERESKRNQSSNAVGWLLLGIGIGVNGVSRGTQQLRRHGSNLIGFTRRSGISRT